MISASRRISDDRVMWKPPKISSKEYEKHLTKTES
jgi:hypothetical protein